MKRLLVLLGVGLIFGIGLPLAGHAQESPRPGGRDRVFNLTTDMVGFGSPCTRLFIDWQSNANALFQAGFDAATSWLNRPGSRQVLTRIGTLAVFGGASFVVNQAFSLTAHDESHLEAARAIGGYGVSLLRNSDGREMSIWEFFLEAFNPTVEPGVYIYSKDSPSLPEEAYVAGEGLDTNMVTAGLIARKINAGDGHVTDLAPYLLNKSWGINYFLVTGPTSDAENYVHLLNAQGNGAVTSSNVIFLETASCLFSGGFLSLVKGTFDYIIEGESTVDPLGLKIGDITVLWPELTTWLNPDNVSVRILTEAAWKDIVFVQLGVESPILAGVDRVPELTLGARLRVQQLSVGMEAASRFVKVPFFIGTLEIELNEVFSLGIEGHYGEGNTMRERREYPLGPGAVGFLKARL
jgi:hypothetical protein